VQVDVATFITVNEQTAVFTLLLHMLRPVDYITLTHLYLPLYALSTSVADIKSRPVLRPLCINLMLFGVF